MDDPERVARGTRLRDAAMQQVREENERLAREAARDNCAQCPEAKATRDEVVSLPNGVQLSVYVAHCQRPAADCTAQVCAHLVSESPEAANRMVRWLAAQPDLKAAGVNWMASLAPGAAGADRLILTCRVPELARLTAAVGAVPVEAFRRQDRA
jgi:hypothetical protein